jgi:hypothetical protein
MMPRSCFLFLFSFLCCNPLSAQQIKSPEGFMLKLSEEQAINRYKQNKEMCG